MSQSDREPLLGRDTARLEALAVELGEPAYRGRQLARWLYQAGCRDLAAMSDLPARFRERLAALPLGRAEPAAVQASADGTRKLLLRLHDGQTIETVALPYPRRLSVCVSSQTGCAVGCTFCATGYLGAGRNLTAGEMVDQVMAAGEAVGRRATHVVFMGMGEPLLNLESVVAASGLLRHEVGLSQRHLTVSTVGLPEGIRKLAEHELQVTLAVSLHAADDALRGRLIPTVGRRYKVAEVLAAAREYAAGTGRRVTYEVVLLRGVNDRAEDARGLARRLRPGEHVNLIPYNPVGEAGFQRSEPATIRTFRAVLEAAGLTVTKRQTRGVDIAGACGQLRAMGD